MQDQAVETRQQVRRVLTITLVLNMMVALGKITVGLTSGALAITADGFHSIIDGSANLIGIVASAIAAKPPDDDHPYGHRRFETLAALMIGAFLLLVAWEVATGALDRLQSASTPDLTPLTFAVLIGTLVVNLGVSTYERREGERLNAELLLADAQNTRVDVFVTLSVLVSMGLITLTGWGWIDVAAALVVVALIARTAWRILRDTGLVLVDTAPYTPDELRSLLVDLPSVLAIERVRSRGPRDEAHIDVDVCVAPAMTAAQTEAITQAVRDRLTAGLDNLREVEVHFSPQATHQPDYALVSRAAADALGLRTHEVIVTATDDDRVLEMHVEVPPSLTLDAAHETVTTLERDLHGRLPEIDTIITHIEPAHVHAQATAAGDHETVLRDALALLRSAYPSVDWHDMRVLNRESGTALTLHAALAPQMTVSQAHAIAEEAETLLRANLSTLDRVTIHTEPYDHR